MSISYEPREAGSSLGNTSHDPVLAKLAATNTFDSDWPALRQHIQLALTAALPLFQALGPPRTSVRPVTPPVPGPSSSPLTSSRDLNIPTSEDAKPPPESLLLSPSQPITSIESTTPQNPTTSEPRSVDVEPGSSPQEDREELKPSTPGGMIIPPFPPLDGTRKRRNSISAGSQSPSPSLPSQPARLNGHARPTGPYEEEWDEEVVIGGKKLPGWLEEEEGRKQVEKVGKVLDEMDYAPFTIQRVAELLLNPTSRHTSLGKFLRAVEKALLVSTPWQPPSYVYIPNTTIPSQRPVASSSTEGSDEAAMMPPRSATPMFSPIAFLPQSEEGGLGMDIEPGHEGVNGRSLEDGLMSPLMLGGDNPNPNTSGTFQFAPSPQVRSPTPEPDEAGLNTTSGESDPSHQSFLGRVDELDTGPLATPPQINGKGRGSEREEEIMTPGQGEGGNMTPHGMSQGPVPISSTTVLEENERPVAGLPKGGSLAERFVSETKDEGEGDRTEVA